MANRIIRKYGNRRLYDTASKRYVNFEEIARMIRDGDEIQVVDAKTGEDLTRSILTQIIVDDTRTRDGGLPVEILKELIALSGRANRDGLLWYLRTAFETYRRAQHIPLDLMRTMLAPKRSPESAPEGEVGVEDLLRRIEELERRLDEKKSG